MSQATQNMYTILTIKKGGTFAE